jgi:hypothetical protein
MWLKSLYNVTQMELTTLNIIGAFYLVALDADWELRPENILHRQQQGIRARQLFSPPKIHNHNVRPQCPNSHHFFPQLESPRLRNAATYQSRCACSYIGQHGSNHAPKHRLQTSIWHWLVIILNMVKELKAMFGTS